MDFDEYTKPSGPWTSIDGWNQQGAFTALKAIHEMQRDEGIFGNIGEIGVHEGQFLFAMMLLADAPKERILAIDVFDDKKRNIDHSGGTTTEVFHRNLRKLIPKELERSLRICNSDSLTLKEERLIALASSAYIDPMGVLDTSRFDSEYTPLFRLFSVDGGHTVVHVLNDLRLVERVMVPGGVVLVDDFMHPKWPGVTEGLHIYCTDSASLLVPFAYGNNKMYLATFDYAKRYSWMIQESMKKVLDRKEVELWNRTIHYLQYE